MTSFAAGRAWTEHSERAWLDSIAAMAGIPREQREFLGRWRASACVDEYVRTAQQTVCGLQRNIVQLVLAGQVHGASSLGLRDLREHLSSAGLDQAAIENQLALFDLGNWISQPTSMPPEVRLPAVPQEDGPADEEVAGARKYFVCVTKNRRFRRLHRWGGCGSSPGRNVQEFEGFDSLDGVLYDAACKHCWKQGVLEADNATAPLRQKAQMIAWPQIEVSVNSHACSICYGLVAFANMCCWLALFLHGLLASVC